MHSFHQSRGRILFEVLCAVGIAASCGGAWIQTGASALLAAASVATLYSLVHFFDLFRREPSLVAEPQRIDFAPDGEADLLAGQDAVEPEPLVEVAAAPLDQQPVIDHLVEQAKSAEAPAPPERAPRKAKASRKGGGRAKTPKPVVAEVAPINMADIAEPRHLEPAEVAEFPPFEDADCAEPMDSEEPVHSHIAPLFEPEPFARMPRRAFGRRGRI